MFKLKTELEEVKKALNEGRHLDSIMKKNYDDLLEEKEDLTV